MAKKSIFHNMDWKLLREQKLDLLNVIDLHQRKTDEAKKRQISSLFGILHLIDSIQDEAVDVDGLDESEVFCDFSKEEA